MKLYTEEQVIHMLNRARLHNQDDTEMFTNDYLISREIPIELPSDKEIEESETDSPYDRIDEYNYGFIDGANWVKQYILNQNK